ncbi:MAG: hypothetical protein M0R76_09715 [Proteobacteria bacterium]|nr:hypothetical protein [Pseudomonadota bacterium]
MGNFTTAPRTQTAFWLATLVLIAAGCAAPPYRMDIPDAFKQYDTTQSLKWISADGVMLHTREVKNDPKAPATFWQDALIHHMTAQGYAHSATDCFTTQQGQHACTSTFLLPKGNQDWVLSETLFVGDKKIVLVEVTGEYARYEALADDIATALRTFAPNR